MRLQRVILSSMFLCSLSMAAEGLLVRQPTFCVRLLAQVFERPSRFVEAFRRRQLAAEKRLNRWQMEYIANHQPTLESISASLADELQASIIAFAGQLREHSLSEGYLAGMFLSTILLNESRDVRNIQWIFSDQFEAIAARNLNNLRIPPTKEMFEPFTAEQFYEMVLGENTDVKNARLGQEPLNEFIARVNRSKPLAIDEVAVLVSEEHDDWGYLAFGPVSEEFAPWVEHVFGIRSPQGVLVRLTSICARGAQWDAVEAGTKKKRMTLAELKRKQMNNAERPRFDEGNVIHYGDSGSIGRFVYIALVAMKYFNNERVRFVIPRFDLNTDSGDVIEFLE